MTLPASGLITLSNVNTELGRSSTQIITLDDYYVRLLAGVPSGQIAMSNLYGKNASTVSISGNNQNYSGLQEYGYFGKDGSFGYSGFNGYGLAARSSGNPWYTSNQAQYNCAGYGGGQYGPNTITVTAGVRPVQLSFSATGYANAHALFDLRIYRTTTGSLLNQGVYNVNQNTEPYTHYYTLTATDTVPTNTTYTYNIWCGTQVNGDYDYSRWNNGIWTFSTGVTGYSPV
jgi:hypothetical protein